MNFTRGHSQLTRQEYYPYEPHANYPTMPIIKNIKVQTRQVKSSLAVKQADLTKQKFNKSPEKPQAIMKNQSKTSF